VLEVTIDGSGGATSGILWGNTGAPFAHILIPPAGPPVLDPPQNLTVQAVNDSIILNWDPPGGGETTEELIYDNGVPTAAYSWNGNTMATHMSPSGPCKILRLKYYTVTDTGDNTFNAEIYDWAGSQPGTSLLFSAPVTAVDDSWLELDISSQNITFSTDFVVGFGSINGTTFLGFDANHNNGRSFDFDGSNWSAWTEAYFIRAIVEYQTGEMAELSPVTYSLVDEHAGSETVKIAHKRFNQNKKIKAVALLSENLSHEYSPLGLIGYKVYCYGNLITTVPSNQTSYTHTNLIPGSYCYTITGLYDEGESDSTNRECTTITNVESYTNEYPTIFVLSNNYPNPFNPATNIKYQIPEISFVTIKIYDLLGNEMSTLVSDEKPAGYYEIEFDATTLPSGIYFYRLQAVPTGRQGSGQSFVETKKMILLK
jgi:hypothetical protein